MQVSNFEDKKYQRLPAAPSTLFRPFTEMVSWMGTCALTVNVFLMVTG